MNPVLTTILAAVIAGLLGSGVCSIVLYFIQRHDKKKDEKCGGSYSGFKLASYRLQKDKGTRRGITWLRQ